jgi:hypothetical protein
MSIYGLQQLTQKSGSVFAAAIAATAQNFKQGRMPAVGDRQAFEDGRVFHFARAGGTIGVGDIVAAVPNSQAIAATYFGATAALAPIVGEGGAVGDTQIRFSADVTGVTANEFAGGYLNITDATGEGYQYRIKANQATGASGTGALITLYDPLILALDATSVGTMTNHPLDGVVTHTAPGGGGYGGTATQFIVGKGVRSAADGEYFWIQTWGPCLLQAGTGTGAAAGNGFHIGAPLQPAEDDNGSVQGPVDSEHEIQTIGIALTAAADTVWGTAFLMIMP